MILPSNFTIEKFGLFARFVEESDAEYILKLRTAEKAVYMHRIKNDVDAQKSWIREYKKREAKGKDYYFIFFCAENKNAPIGLNRIYDIRDNGVFSTGSWIFDSNAPFGAAFLAQIICRDIAFGELGLIYEEEDAGTHIDNKPVLKWDSFVGMEEVGRYYCDEGEYISLALSQENYFKGRQKILKMLGKL